MATDPENLTRAEAAALMGVDVATVSRMLRTGILPGSWRDGRTRSIPREAVEHRARLHREAVAREANAEVAVDYLKEESTLRYREMVNELVMAALCLVQLKGRDDAQPDESAAWNEHLGHVLDAARRVEQAAALMSVAAELRADMQKRAWNVEADRAEQVKRS